ncbi:MAG TPA: thioredoxin domain-containing protein [Candidatus Limnocylindrales bacterium]|nr:thioredoxin domain-containing protein [Candidatus Limnocylindrales bacterium]
MDEKHEFQINSCSLRARSWSRGQIASLAVVAALVLSAAMPVGANPRPNSAGHTTPRQMKPVKSQNLPPIEEAYGSRSAPITMEVFSDYSCPMCRNLFEQTLRPMINDYVASGKVYLIHRDYPLAIPGHQYSPQAARWARAAAKIGQFENVEGAFYDNQTSWSTDGNLEKYVSAAMSTADFKRVQKLMEACEPPGPTGRPDGINMPPHPCSLDPYIEQDILLGNQVPVKGTPTYVITYKGQRLPPGSGFVSWPLLKQFFDSLLAQ